ncbi:MAG TPA: S1C family serine protease [Actinomycetota bacterium]|nr:S1C family serine protease [Actinomycetota bacterium]
MSVIDELQGLVGGIAQSVGASVVGIGNRRARGSGIVVAPGKVLTNAHNLWRDEVHITFHDGRTATGKLAGADVDGDIAVVDVDTNDAPALEVSGNGTTPDLGQVVFALSNPGGRGLRVTFGLVSGTQRSFRGPRGRRITGSLEHTAPLLPGSSGGPVVDSDGRLLGVNTNRLGEGFYLAIPADSTLRNRMDNLARGETPARPQLGIGVAPAEVARGLRRAVGLDEVDGLLVRQVMDDGPAHAAGVREGDLIVEAGGRSAADADALFEALADAAGSIELKVLRGVEERSITVDLS